MNLEATAEQQLLVATLDRLLASVDGERLRSVWGRGFLHDEYAALVDMGLIELIAEAAAPEDPRLVEVVLIGEALGRCAAITPAVTASMSAALMGPASPPTRGEVWAVAGYEPGHGRFLVDQATTVDGRGRVSGRKVHVELAGHATGFVVLTGRGVVAVEAAAPGVTVSEGEVIGGVPTGQVRFDAAPSAAVSGSPTDDAWATTLLLQAGYLVGAAGRLLELTRDHVLARQQFGAPLATFQVVKHHLATSKISLDGARLLVLHTAWFGPCPTRLALAAEAKAYAATVANEIARRAHELHGGVSVVDDHEVSLLSRRVIAETAMYGSPRELWSISGSVLARSVVGIPA